MELVPERIRRLRELAGLKPADVATRIWMNAPSYYDLETVPDEWESAVEFRQLLELSRILKTSLLELIGESPTELISPCSFHQLADLIRSRINEGLVDAKDIGWDLGEFWEEPSIAMEYPVLFLKIVDEDIGIDWKGPIKHYQDVNLENDEQRAVK